MPTQRSIFDENPSLDGPDYVALVIEWDELADNLERELLEGPSAVQPRAVADVSSNRTRNIVVAAAGAIGLAGLAWLVHRIRS